MKGASREHGRRVLGGAGVALVLAAALLATASPAAAEPPTPGYFGIAPAAPENLTDDEYARMGKAEIGTLRVPFYWPHIQPETQAGEPGGEPGYKWAYTDRIVTQATINGMKVLPFVYGTPNWAGSSVRLPPVRSERARRAWEGLFRALVGRYGPGGDVLDDAGAGAGGPRPDPDHRLADLERAQLADVHEAGPRHGRRLRAHARHRRARDPRDGPQRLGGERGPVRGPQRRRAVRAVPPPPLPAPRCRGGHRRARPPPLCPEDQQARRALRLRPQRDGEQRGLASRSG